MGGHHLVNGKTLGASADDLGQASHVMSSPTYSSAAAEGVTV